MSVTPHYERVRAFMQAAGQDTPSAVTMPSEEIRRLRAKLILEEALETIEGLGFHVLRETTNDDDRRDPISIEDVTFQQTDAPPSLEGIIDGCADVSVVTIGTLIACGVPDETLLRLVDENNLAKFGPGGFRREDGKWTKPPGHKPPDITGFIASLPGKCPTCGGLETVYQGDHEIPCPRCGDDDRSNPIYPGPNGET